MTRTVAQTYFDEESGELMLDLPQEVIDTLGFEPGDMVEWAIDVGGRVTFSKYYGDAAEASENVTEIVSKSDKTS
jgi:hypothetical protein